MKFRIREYLTLHFVDLRTGKEIICLDALKVSDLPTIANEIYAKGGSGGRNIVRFSEERKEREG